MGEEQLQLIHTKEDFKFCKALDIDVLRCEKYATVDGHGERERNLDVGM